MKLDMKNMFALENEKLKTAQQKFQVKDPVRWRGRNPKITLLVDLPFSETKCRKVLELISSRTSLTPDDVEIIYCYIVDFQDQDPTKKDKTPVQIRAWDYSSDLSTLLTRGRNVVAMGRAFYSITLDVDVELEGFYDSNFNDTFIRYQDKACNVYPTAGLFTMFKTPKDDKRIGDAGLELQDVWDTHFFVEQFKRAAADKFDLQRERPVVQHLLEGPEEVNQFFWDNVGPGEMSWDLETSGYDYQRDEIIDLSFTFSLNGDQRPGHPVAGVDGYHAFWRDVDVEAFSAFLEGKKQYGANLKFDIRFTRHLGVKNTHIDMDTWICGHILNELRGNSLKIHAWNYTSLGGYELPLEKWKRAHPTVKSYKNIPDNIRVPYSIYDPVVNFRVAKRMYEELQFDKDIQYDLGHTGRDNLLDYHEDHVVPAINMFVDLELQGVCVDWNRVEEVSQLLKQKIHEAEEDVYKVFGSRKINLNSGTELGKFLEAFGYPELPKGRTKTGVFKTNKELLQEWEKRGLAGAKELMVHAKWQALQNTFVGEDVEEKKQQLRDNKSAGSFMSFEDQDEAKFLNKKAQGLWQYRGTDDRVHAQFLAFLALSHRHRSKDPNLQNIPKRDKESAMLLRSVYSTPQQGEFYIVEPDFAGVQLRIAAAQSNDESMRRAFKEVPGGDLHSVTGRAVFARKLTVDEFIKKKKETPYKHYRDKSKNINFGFEFGSSARAFMENVLFAEWSMQEAEDYARDNNLSARVAELEFDRNPKRREDHRTAVYLACAEDIRRVFFELYPGLVPWHEACIREAHQLGFVRSPFGARRLFPRLTYVGRQDDGGDTKNMENQSINTRVQNHEVIPMSYVMVKIHNLIKKKQLKSQVVLTVHDAVKLYVHRTELYLIVKETLKAMAHDWPENNGIPVFGEANIARPWSKTLPDGTILPPELWGFGKLEITLENVDKICELVGEDLPQVAA